MTDATLTFTVGDDDTAEALGSGSLPVLGTPRLLAWCEAATCEAIEVCREKMPEFTDAGATHRVRCWRAQNMKIIPVRK